MLPSNDILRSLVGALALAATGAAHAVNFDGAYESEHERDTGLAASGFSAGISQDVGPHFFVGASYAQLRTDPFDDGGANGRLEYVSGAVNLGAGYALSERIDIGGSVGLAGSETRGLDGFKDDPVDRVHGPAGALMLSARVHKWTWLFVGPAYSYMGRVPGWTGNAGVKLQMLRSVWLTTSYWGGEYSQGWNAGLSKDFGAN
jgi:hypothetical protein